MINRLQQLDQKLLLLAYNWPFRRSLLVRFLIFAGDGPFWMILIFASALLGQILQNQQFTQLSISLMLAMAVGNLLLAPLKKHMKRQRPYANKQLQQQLGQVIENRDPGHGSKVFESFPSGHVYWTTLCVLVLYSGLGWPVLLLMGWMIPAMLLLRPHLGVHYPSDVFSGLLLGLAMAVLVLYLSPLLMQWLQNYQQMNYFPLFFWGGVAGFMLLGIKAWKKRV